MTNYREILRLYSQGISQRDIDGKRMDDIGISRVKGVLEQYEKLYKIVKEAGSV